MQATTGSMAPASMLVACCSTALIPETTRSSCFTTMGVVLSRQTCSALIQIGQLGQTAADVTAGLAPLVAQCKWGAACSTQLCKHSVW